MSADRGDRGAGVRLVRRRVRAVAERWARDLPPARRLRFALAMRVLEGFAGGRPLTILDAGCGEGLMAAAVARRHPDWRIVAADLDREGLRRARALLQASGVRNVHLVQLDLTRPLGRACYDAVLALECLVEIPDDDAALRQMVQVLRPGGLLLSHVPEQYWRPVLPGSPGTWRHEVRHGYLEPEVKEKLEHAGAEVTAVVRTTRGTVAVAQEIRDRCKGHSLKVQATLYPLMLGAVWLERVGATWGPARAMLVEARRR
jgi:SAM-dependent methyltransferase